MREPEDLIREKYEPLRAVMDERLTRLWVAAEARALGRGGVAIIRRATGIRGKRVRAGVKELKRLKRKPPTLPAHEQRVRRPGAGRKPLEETDPMLLSDLESLVDPVTRGDPESALRWTTKSAAHLAGELRRKGHRVSESKVRQVLYAIGYRLQANNKTREGSRHPDRDAQFEHINAQAERFLAAGQPVISVDTKKKELIGDFKNGGREWHPKGSPEPVRVHDFLDQELGKAIPYGVYDLARNEAWVSVGKDHDTAEFAAATIGRWWKTMGKRAYPEATQLFITADSGGSNGARNRLWKVELQDFADRTGLAVHVSHFPPGTSKWNKIEHRLFSQISQNWRGRPLCSHEAVVNLIANTRTTTGLKVKASLDTREYPPGVKVSNTLMQQLRLRPLDFHGEWNYVLLPNKINMRSVISA